jgi:hypothetical protein
VGGAIGYTGTFAMGKAAIEYFRRTTELPAGPPRTSRTATGETVIDAEVTPVDPSESTP